MKSAKPAALIAPVRRVVPFREVHGRRGEELAFLPAALEIVETPPSPIGRTIAATIILLFCAALVWAWWGTIDIVASATGKIVPSGRTKVVQPFETGVVRSIRVEDGQAVKAGDVLIELDPTVNAAERDHLHNDLIAERLNIARLRAVLAGGNDPVSDFTPPDGADPALVGTQRQVLLNQVAEHRAKVAALARQQVQKEAEQSTTAATGAALRRRDHHALARQMSRKRFAGRPLALERLHGLRPRRRLLRRQFILGRRRCTRARSTCRCRIGPATAGASLAMAAQRIPPLGLALSSVRAPTARQRARARPRGRLKASCAADRASVGPGSRARRLPPRNGAPRCPRALFRRHGKLV
jgi:multidrug efflux pump subunit AcrA (membrane-fusion protein)